MRDSDGDSDGGTGPDSSDAAVDADPATRTTWLRASGRALRKVTSWFLDRVGFLS